MQTQLVWRKYFSYSKSGKTSGFSEAYLPRSAEVLREILAMPRGGREAIDYDKANILFFRAYCDQCLDPKTTKSQCDRFLARMIPWLTEQGYYLELRHDEYDSSLERMQ